MVALVKEVSASVFVRCQDTYILDGAIDKVFAEEFTRRLIAGQCLDIESVKQKLAEAGVATGAAHDAWLEAFVASHGTKAPKRLDSVSADAANSFGYLTQPLAVMPLLDESIK